MIIMAAEVKHSSGVKACFFLHSVWESRKVEWGMESARGAGHYGQG